MSKCCVQCEYPTYQKESTWNADDVTTIHLGPHLAIPPGFGEGTPRSSRFSFYCPNNLVGKRIAGARLTQLDMENTFMNVPAGQIINFVESNDVTPEFSAELIPGEYTASNLVAMVEDVLNNTSNSATYTVERDASTRKITISIDAGTFKLLWATGSDATSTSTSGALDINHAYALLGFSKEDSSSLPSLESDRQYSLHYQRYFYVSISPLLLGDPFGNLSRYEGVRTLENHNTTYRLPIRGEYGNRLELDAQTFLWKNDGSKEIRAPRIWRVAIFDQNMIEIDYSTHWMMTLDIFTQPEKYGEQPWKNTHYGGEYILS